MLLMTCARKRGKGKAKCRYSILLNRSLVGWGRRCSWDFRCWGTRPAHGSWAQAGGAVGVLAGVRAAATARSEVAVGPGASISEPRFGRGALVQDNDVEEVHNQREGMGGMGLGEDLGSDRHNVEGVVHCGTLP